MYKIFFLTCIVIGSFAEDSDSREEKYIDLLPEHEKKEFLEKIARRIFEEIQSKNVKDATSGELSDDKLEAQDEYVTKLLKEESKNLRRGVKKPEDTEKSSHNSDSSKEKETKLGTDVDDKIDLTLREGKRNKRNKSRESSNETEDSSATVKQENKSAENISVEITVKDKNEKTSNEEDKTTTMKSESGENIPVKVVYDEVDTTNAITEGTKQVLRTKKYASKENEGSATEITDYSPEESKSVESVEASTTIDSTNGNESLTLVTTSQPVTEDVNKSDVKLEDEQGITERIFESIKQNSEDVSSDNEKKPDAVNNNATLSSESASNEESQEVSTVATETTIIQDEKEDTTKHLKDESANSTQLDQPKLLTPLLRTVAKNNETHSGSEKDGNSATRRNNDILSTTLLDTNSLETSSKDPANDTESKVFSTSEKTEIKEKNLSNKTVLRHGFYETSTETQIEYSKLFHNIPSGHNGDKVKHYEVFEVSPDKLPFVKLPQKLKPLVTEQPFQSEDHPYYVPVYNYAPNKAYFNPYNRLGPNFDDKESDGSYEEPSILREHLVKPHSQALSNLKKYFKPTKLNRPVFTNNNLQDYFDMDYYFGRSDDGTRKRHKLKKDRNLKIIDLDETLSEEERPKSMFPNSDESDHPFNNIHLKDHMSSIRQILYANKVFGHVPIRTEPPTLRPIKQSTVFLTTLPSPLPSTDVENLLVLRSKGINSDLSKEYHNQIIKRPYNYKQKFPISADYYFGESEVKRSHIKKLFRADDEESNATDSTTEKPKKYSNADIRMLLDMSDPADLIPTLDKIISINSKDQKAARNRDDIDSYLKVLKDMINSDSRALNQYDWLRTAVDIRSALKKLADLSQQIISSEPMHPADSELLKYILYLHKSTKKGLRDDNNHNEETLILAAIFERGILPRNKHPHNKLIKTKGLIHRVWLRMVKGNNEFRNDLKEFDDFLNDLEFGLYNLHYAIKNIAMITRYNNQRWFRNLKDLYLSNITKKQLLELLLHFSTVRLINLLEQSSTKGVEDGFLDYIDNNKEDFKKTRQEFLFVLTTLEELNHYYN